MIHAKKESPPERRRGRGGGAGRPVSPDLIDAMRTVANNPDEWFRVAVYTSRGSASSAANRMRQRDWDSTLGIKKNGKMWEIVSRSYEDPNEGVGVFARRQTGKKK